MEKEIIIFKPFNSDTYIWGWKQVIPPTVISNEPYKMTFYPDKIYINKKLISGITGIQYD